MGYVREMEVTYRRLPTDDQWVGSHITSSRDLACLVRAAKLYEGAIDESAWIIMLSADNHVVGLYRISEGGPSESAVYPAKVFRGCILAGAIAFVLVHNHPSGSPYPSAGDRVLTEELVKLAEAMGMPCMDHVIMPNDSEAWYSFADQGLIDEYKRRK